MSSELQLPDVDRMFELIDKSERLSMESSILKVELEFNESAIALEAISNEKYFVNGKPPAMSFLETTWLRTGFNNELMEKRLKLATMLSELDTIKMKLNLYNKLIDLYRTQSANERVLVS